ncbi:MAG TPA: Lrp/AsnC ligand binding domain-containing protein [Chloroflexota bacterium]|nr:Lrp/AsnC ligand binding domain-containing protein [Chloroflexota bacterium]
MNLDLRFQGAAAVELKEVLRQVPGLNKRLIYYLESQGFTRPRLLRKERISRRDYSIEDLHRLKRFWRYYQRGFSVRSAIEATLAAERSAVIAFLPVPVRDWRRVLDLLRQFENVSEAAVVYGESGDLLVRLGAVDERDAYDVLDRVFEAAGVPGMPRLWRVAESVRFVEGRAAGTAPGEARMLAYVLIKAPPKQVGSVIEELRRFPGVVEACALYGESDAIVKIQVSSQDELDDLVMNRIHGLPAVESTRTFIAVGGMHWERPPGEHGG